MSGGRRRSRRRSVSGGKRKLNEYFKKMLEAKKHGDPQFTYKGKIYKREKTSGPLGYVYRGPEKRR